MLFLYLMMGETAEKTVKKEATELVCERCGAKFSCGAETGECWCFAVELKAETLTGLKENFNGCLCRKCLNDLSKRVQRNKN